MADSSENQGVADVSAFSLDQLLALSDDGVTTALDIIIASIGSGTSFNGFNNGI